MTGTSALPNDLLEIRPLAGAIGAEVHGVQLNQSLSEQTIGQLRAALNDNLVIFFRDQTLTPAEHARFGASFGTLHIHPLIKGLDDQPEVMEFVKEPRETGYVVGGEWHSDLTFTAEPSMASILYAHEVPPYGGDTLFANMYLAYESLSDGMRRLLDGLRAVHSAAASYGAGGRFQKNKEKGQGKMRIKQDLSGDEVVHPVVRTHPETGRKLLYINRGFAQRFENMTREESKPLLDFLCAHLARPEFTCRFRWKEGSVAFWDNRCTQHLAVNDYDGYRRRMHRVTINGNRPY